MKTKLGLKKIVELQIIFFSIKTIIDQYNMKKEKFFAGFIDLPKAFDTIWRIGLFFFFNKLLQSKTPTKILNVILLESECGVKQGDVRSPLIFNIFYDDITNELKKYNCDPVKISISSINCLLYADV